MSKKHTDPRYYEINRIETGLNHIDRGRVTYSHISDARWEEIFGPKDSRSYSGERGKQAHTSQEFEDALSQAPDRVDDRSLR